MAEILLSSSALILVLVLLRGLLRRRIPARLVYALWLPVLIRLLVPVSFYQSPVSVAGAAAPAVTRLEELSDTAVFPERPGPEDTQPEPAGTARGVSRWTLRDAAGAVRITGMAVMAGWFAAMNVSLARRLRRCRVPYDGDHGLPVYVAAEIPSPCLFGLFRPAIYLTEHAAEDAEQARQIIAHELTHFRHGDLLWALLRGVCLVLWWFDPLVWLAAALSRQDGELACDEGTIRVLGEEARFDYGRTLLGMAKVGARPSDLLCGATTMTSGRKTLRERIERIARRTKTSAAVSGLVLLIAAAAVGCTYAGAAPKKAAPAQGAEVFRRYYAQTAPEGRTDPEILDAMASVTVGPVVDTEELTVEVAGAIVSGNTAEIVLLVTAKQLDSVLYDNGTAYLPNYRFGDETAMLGITTLGRRFLDISHRYTYCDTDETLSPNQFTLHYWIRVPEPFENGTFRIPLTDFGFYSPGGAPFVPLYQETWQVDIDFSPDPTTAKRIAPEQEVMLGGYRFILSDAQFTPLAFTLRLKCAEDEAAVTAGYDGIFGALSQEGYNCSLRLKDGTVLEGSTLTPFGGGAREYPLELTWGMAFRAPLDTDAVESLSAFGCVISPQDGVSVPATVGEQYAAPDPGRHEDTGALSDREPQTTEPSGNTFTLRESFYDGESLMLAYSLECMQNPVRFGFGPGDEDFDRLRAAGRWYIDGQWENMVSAEDFDRICALLRGEEKTGFVIRTAYLGDHIRLTDGTDLGPMLSNSTADGSVVLECQEGLPAAAKDRDALELVFTIREMLFYYYKDGDTFYRYTENLSEETVTVSVPNNK